jgi:hypothetical protein
MFDPSFRGRSLVDKPEVKGLKVQAWTRPYETLPGREAMLRVDLVGAILPTPRLETEFPRSKRVPNPQFFGHEGGGAPRALRRFRSGRIPPRHRQSDALHARSAASPRSRDCGIILARKFRSVAISSDRPLEIMTIDAFRRRPPNRHSSFWFRHFPPGGRKKMLPVACTFRRKILSPLVT